MTDTVTPHFRCVHDPETDRTHLEVGGVQISRSLWGSEAGYVFAWLGSQPVSVQASLVAAVRAPSDNCYPASSPDAQTKGTDMSEIEELQATVRALNQRAEALLVVNLRLHARLDEQFSSASFRDAQAQQAAQDERNVVRDLRASRRPSDDAFRLFTGGTIEVARLSREGAMRLAHDLFDLLDFGVPHLPGMPTEDQSLHRLLMTIYQLEGAMSFEAYEAKNGLDTTDHQRLLDQLARVRVAVRFAFRKLEKTGKWLFADATPMEGPR